MSADDGVGSPVRVALMNDYEVVVSGLQKMLGPYADRVRVVELDTLLPVQSDVDVLLYDAFGRVKDSGSVVVDVLEGAYDPDGQVDDLTVAGVSGDESATVVDGVSVRADRGASPKVLPFVVEPDRRTAFAELVLRSNWRLLTGAFQLDLDSGQAVFRTMLFLSHGAEPADELLRGLVYGNVLTVDRCLVELQAVAEGADTRGAFARLAL